MILYLDDLEDLKPEDLLARPDKQGGRSVRGPLVRLDSSETPLKALEDGSKLHIAGRGDGILLSGHTPEHLAALLGHLGLRADVRLKQIHLIADRTGAGASDSYASRLTAALAQSDFQVDEVKAPRGDVRCDTGGKIWVRLSASASWQPSSPALNLYVGSNIQAKHRV